MKWVGADWDLEVCVVAYEVKGRVHTTKKRNPCVVAEFMASLDDPTRRKSESRDGTLDLC